jgi:LytR cell envelope-related transcriptional attenuator
VRRRQREQLSGIALALLGIVVLVVAVIALQNPKGRVSNAQDASGSVTSSVSNTTRSATASSRTATSSTSASPKTSSRASAPTRSSSTPANVKSVPLIVLNNTTISGLAKDAASRFRAGGWTVTSYANLSNTIISTCAYYDAADPLAKAAAKALQRQYPTIKRVEPKFAELPGGPVVVVLTPGYSAA